MTVCANIPYDRNMDRRFVIVPLLVGLLASNSKALVFDLTDDWSDTANPNGQWTLESDIGVPFTTNFPDWFGGNSGQKAWAHAPLPDNAHVPMWCKNTCNFFNDAELGDIIMHGAETDRTGSYNTSAVLTVPNSEIAYIAGSLWMPRQLGRTMNWYLIQGATILQSGTITGDGSTSRNNRVRFSEQRFVTAGQRIELRFESVPEVLGELVGVTFHVETAPAVQGKPTRLFVDEGDYLFGEQDACDTSNNDYFAILSHSETLRATLGVGGYTPNLNPNTVAFKFEGSAARYGLSIDIRLLNSDTNAYQTMYGALAPTTDQTVTVETSTNPGRFVNFEGLMRAQISWQPINDEDPSQDGWLLQADYAHWTVT